MESTLEPDMGPNLKIIMAEHIAKPDRKNVKESALVLNDMLNAIGNGQNELDIITKSKYYDVLPDGTKPPRL